MVLPTLGNTLTTTVNMLVAATRAGCERIVLMGSAEEPEGDAPLSSPYAAAKSAARGYGQLFSDVYQTPVTIARPFIVYGPDQPDESKLIPYTLASLLAGVPPRLSSGGRRCDWVFIDDVVDGLLTVATRPECIGRTVDLGTGISTTVRGVVDTLCDLVGPGVTPHWGARGPRTGDGSRRRRGRDSRAVRMVRINRRHDRVAAYRRVVRTPSARHTRSLVTRSISEPSRLYSTPNGSLGVYHLEAFFWIWDSIGNGEY